MLALTLGEWASSVRFGDLPADVIAATKQRVLDVVGLVLAGAETPFGRGTRAAAVALGASGPARLLGSGARLPVGAAAYANAACAQGLEFDDTHNESIVHMSSPAVAATLALADALPVSGREAIAAVAVANEISCRVGIAAPGQFHRRGFHPTGLFAPFGVTFAAGRVLGLDAPTLAAAAGICGSSAAGLLECWVDGTDSKFLHSGWAAQNGIAAALLASTGVTGPPTILEGRFGLFASHLPPGAPQALERITDGLGERWESRNASLKPYPAAHVLHPYVDAVLRIRARDGILPADVARIDCPVAEFNVSIVCEPLAEKLAPSTESHARISLQYTIAEAFHRGSLGKGAYRTPGDEQILALARRVYCHVDPSFPPPGRFKGEVRLTLHDGRTIVETQEYNRGSMENPMSFDELRAKFDDNAAGFLSADQRERVVSAAASLEDLDSVSTLVDAAVSGVAAAGEGAHV